MRSMHIHFFLDSSRLFFAVFAMLFPSMQRCVLWGQRVNEEEPTTANEILLTHPISQRIRIAGQTRERECMCTFPQHQVYTFTTFALRKSKLESRLSDSLSAKISNRPQS